MLQRERTIGIDVEAANWLARIDREPLSDEETAKLKTWIASDRRHAGAFARAQAINILADRAAAQIGREPQSFLQSNASTVARPRWLLPSAIAAMLVACAALGSYLYVDFARRVSTDVGEIRRSPLEDGSLITLNTASTVQPEFDEHVRKIRLLAGEVLFDVAKDAKRPFVVDAGEVDVVAVGTSFVVKRLPGQPIYVIVREGIVDVRNKQSRAVARLAAGNELTVPGTAEMKPEITPLRIEQVADALSWRQGMISLNDTSLDDAVREFNRYNQKHIVINDAALAKRRIAGLYSAADPQGFARAAALSLGAKSGADAKKIWIGVPSKQ